MVKKVVIISNNHVTQNIGGAEVQANMLAKNMSIHGLEIHYVSGDVTQRFVYEGYQVHPMPRKRKELLKLLGSINADIYYQRGRKSLTGRVASFCKKQGKVFVFASSMDIDCNFFKSFFRNKIFRKNQSKIKSLLKALRRNIFNFIEDLYSLWGIYQADLVLSQTVSQKQFFKRKLGIKSVVFYNIHPNPEYIEDDDIAGVQDAPTVLWLANIKSWKQPEIFLRLAEDLSGENINFWMAGFVKERKYKHLIEKAELKNSRFKYFGGQSYETSNQLIAGADLFVNTSKAQEGFPNTFIQSWLRGVPVVSLNFDPDDIIANQKLGYISNTYDQLKKDVLDLSNDSGKRMNMVGNALTYSKEHFLADKKIPEFINLINSVSVN